MKPKITPFLNTSGLYSFDSKGNAKQETTEDYEMMFLEGEKYRRRILHDGQPLSGKESKEEEKKMNEAASARKKHVEKRGFFTRSFQFRFPLDRLESNFDISSGGEEQIDGRKNLVFVAIAKTNETGDLRQAARDGTAYRLQLFVDEQDHVFTRIKGEVLCNGMRYEKGTLITYDLRKVNGEAWLPARFWFRGTVRVLMSDAATETEQTYSSYRKFTAVSKVLP